jgi:IS30 family transposase
VVVATLSNSWGFGLMVRSWSKEEQVANRDRFWSLLTGGVSVTSACEDLGVSRRTGHRWILDTKGQAPVKKPELSGRYLSVDERIRIADLKMTGESVRSIASHLKRSPSTISRELRRNGARGRRYGPHLAQKRAEQRRSRPKQFKLDRPELRHIVQSKLCSKWSPEQVSLHLAERFADQPEMNVAFETIYSALYRENPLPKGLHVRLRTRRHLRRPRGLVAHRRPRIPHMTMIDQRPTEVDDRKQPGHWEGDLIVGSNCRSAIATLVERKSRFLVMVPLPEGHKAPAVRSAIVAALGSLPDTAMRTLTWDQGTELTQHREIASASGISIFFCEPHSPWQRGTNENTNGLIRQYFPKSTDLNKHSAARIAQVAAELNDRPRKTLGMRTPHEIFNHDLTRPTATVATTT